MKKKVYFYFDINEASGLGHYTRCSVLRFFLKRKKIKSVLLILNDKNLKKYKEFKIVNLKDIHDKKKKDILIIDNYQISEKKIFILKKYFKLIFLVDDKPSKKKGIDVIINSNFGINKSFYSERNIKKFFLGEKYKLIKDFITNSKKKSGLTISFGGGKVFGKIKKLLDLIFAQLIDLNYKKKINIFTNLTLNQLIQTNKIKKLNLNLQNIGPKYVPSLLSSDFCISSLGVQHDEILKKKIPAIFVKIDNNQNYNYLFSKKINPDFTFDINNINKNKFSKALKNIIQKKNRDKIIKNYKREIIGQNTFEIVEYIENNLS